MRKGISPNFKIGWGRGDWVPGVFKLNHLQPFEPILLWQFSTFILGANSYYPRGPIKRKRFHPTLKLDETEVIECLGHSNWTTCSPLSLFCSHNFPPFSLSYWGANSYYPRWPIMGKGNSSNLKTEWDGGFSVPGAFKLDYLQPIEPLN